MGGLEIIAHLRDFDSEIKAIISSGYNYEPAMVDYQRYGFVGALSKPYRIEKLLKVLKKVVEPKQPELEYSRSG